MDYKVRYTSSLSHSSGLWKKHKYIKKVGNKYYYAKKSTGSKNGTGTSSGTNYAALGASYGKRAKNLVNRLKKLSVSAMGAAKTYYARGKTFVDSFIAGYKGTSGSGVQRSTAKAVRQTKPSAAKGNTRPTYRTFSNTELEVKKTKTASGRPVSTTNTKKVSGSTIKGRGVNSNYSLSKDSSLNSNTKKKVTDSTEYKAAEKRYSMAQTKLREAGKALEKGQITQQDYDRYKEEAKRALENKNQVSHDVVEKLKRSKSSGSRTTNRTVDPGASNKRRSKKVSGRN